MVSITNGECFRKSELERDIFSLIVTHGILRLKLRPEAKLSLVPSRLRIRERVRRPRDTKPAGDLGVKMKRRDLPDSVGLMPDRFAALQRNRMAVPKASHSLHSSKVVIKRAIFLHQNDNVLDVFDGAGFGEGRNGEGSADAGGQSRNAATALADRRNWRLLLRDIWTPFTC